MLVDQRTDAQLQTMFMVDYQPGAVAHPHDHPFEEAYYMLAGEIEVIADDQQYTLGPGDTFWTAVGCIHASTKPKATHVRWLETSAPGPPTATPTASHATGNTSQNASAKAPTADPRRRPQSSRPVVLVLPTGRRDSLWQWQTQHPRIDCRTPMSPQT